MLWGIFARFCPNKRYGQSAQDLSCNRNSAGLRQLLKLLSPTHPSYYDLISLSKVLLNCFYISYLTITIQQTHQYPSFVTLECQIRHMIMEILTFDGKAVKYLFGNTFHHQGVSDLNVMVMVELGSPRPFIWHLTKLNWTYGCGDINCWPKKSNNFVVQIYTPRGQVIPIVWAWLNQACQYLSFDTLQSWIGHTVLEIWTVDQNSVTQMNAPFNLWSGCWLKVVIYHYAAAGHRSNIVSHNLSMLDSVSKLKWCDFGSWPSLAATEES